LKNILNIAIGRALSEKVVKDKLYRAEMPPAFSLEDLRQIAASFNGFQKPYVDETTGEVIPVAIIVRLETRKDPLSDSADHLEVQPAGKLLKYRQDTRLALVSNECTLIYSVTSAFTNVLTTSRFPEEIPGSLTLENFADAALKTLYDASEIASGITAIEHEKAVNRLAETFRVLSVSHKAIADLSSNDWNELWIKHVSLGLQNLYQHFLDMQSSGAPFNPLEFFAKYTYAAFGLASPKNGIRFDYKPYVIGKEVAKAIENWWTNKEQIHSTLEILRNHPDTKSGAHPLEGENWELFELERLASGNPLLGFAAISKTGIAALLAFSELTEKQFFNPLNSKAPTQILIFDESGESLRVEPITGKSVHLAQARYEQNQEMHSEVLELKLPTLGYISQETFDMSKIVLKIKSDTVTWAGNSQLVENGSLILFKGHFNFDAQHDFETGVLNLVPISISLDPNDGLHGLIDPRANGKIGFIVEGQSGIAIWQNGRELKPVKQLSFTEDHNSSETDVNLGPKQKDIVFVAWGENCSLDSVAVDAYSSRPGWFSQSTKVQDRAEIGVDEQIVQLIVDSEDEGEQSPIIAAIYKRLLTKDPISLENAKSFNGQLEKILVENIKATDIEKLGIHFVLAEGEQFGLSGCSSIDGLTFLGGTESAFANSTNFRVPDSIKNSNEAKEFLAAFTALEIGESLRARSVDSGNWDLPSRTSWKTLARSKKHHLDAYLDSYRNLVAKAKLLDDPDATFWATYPFSFSVWDLKDSGNCKAVFLSPLHPIRLAWLASIEHVLELASQSEFLAGGVEGWNLPIWGPSPKRGGALLATAMDNGEGQLFLGWSCLVRVSGSEPETLVLPRYAGQLETPGTSAGGLNASAATAALVNYGRVNPHVSTLTIDLASTSKSSRLYELDEAVNKLAKKWTEQSASTLPGGFRVFDSLNRLGSPRTDLSPALLHTKNPIPLVWARYEPKDGAGVNCNLRLLQDSGIKLAIASNSDNQVSRGLVADFPLRRFEAFEISNTDPRFGLNFPSLVNNSDNQSIFYKALYEAESLSKESHVVSEIQNAALVDKTAEWTVTGEGMVSPSSISRMIQAKANSNQMLWEWKPPFFDTKSGDMLERRPFLALARIPQSFKSELSRIQKRSFGEDIDAGFTDSLLDKLGTRGVGLSSLLARGGTHASGALGFYLCLETLDSVMVANTQLMVLPIDACDPFLRALSGNANSLSDMTRRADLLLLGVNENRITLIPIEIKFYGSEAKADSHNLPTPLSSKVKDAFDQVAQTRNILELLVTRYHSLRAGNTGTVGDLELWVNSFATMLEAAFKMSPSTSAPGVNLTSVLTKLLSKDIQIELGGSLVTYFEDGAMTENGLGHTKYFGNHDKKVPALFVANPKSCLLNNKPGQVQSTVVKEMEKLVEWALNATPNHAPEGAAVENDAESASSHEGGIVDLGVTSTQESEESVIPQTTQVSSADATDQGSEPEASSHTLSGHGVKIQVGTTIDGLPDKNVAATFWPANTDLNQMNVGVVGDLGTGKTQLLKSLIYQLSEKSREVQVEPLSMLIFDYKDDYTDQGFVEKTGATIVSPERIPLNLFELSGPYSKQKAAQRASKFADVLGRIYSGVGPIQVHNLTMSIIELFEIAGGQPPTINEVLSQYQTKVKGVDAVISTLSKFTIQDIFTENKEEMVSVKEFMDGRLNVIPLTNFNGDADTQNAIVVLFLDLYYEYMLQSKKWDFVGTNPQLRMLNSFLLVDEANSIMKYEFQVLDDILLKGRQFGFGVILASQYLSHFKTKNKNYGEPLLTWIIHKVPQAKESELKALGIVGANAEMAKKISTLPVHGAFYSSLNFENRFIRGLPFFEISD
jgi:DNA phosphorothioation-dependent restriction protein DptH